VGDLEGTSLSEVGVTRRTVVNLQGLCACMDINRGLIYANTALRLSLGSVHGRILLFGEAFLWLRGIDFVGRNFLFQ
jgi:hypothetical protein